MTPQEQAARAIAAMTPQEKAARVIGAIQMGDPPERPLSPIMLAVMAESIRAAVDLVLPEPPAHSAFLPSEYELAAREDWHLEARAQFLAIASSIESAITYAPVEAPTDA